jgi:nicotinamide riboside transporter PnuC
MNTRELENWRKVRVKGERRYILKYGLFWALCYGAGHFLFGLIFKRYLRDGWDYFIYDAVLTAVYFFLGGTLLGLWTWRSNEKKYSRSTVLDEANSFNPSTG